MSFGEDLLESARQRDRDRVDAARYRWWRKHREVSFIVAWFGNGCVNKTVEMAEAKLDEAIAAAGVSPTEGGQDGTR